MESLKTIRFWKAYSISNQTNTALICPGSNMAAILHFTTWPPWNRVSLLSQQDFFGKYENYTFLESLYYKQSEIQCFQLPPVQYGRHFAFCNMATIKHVFVNISALFLWKVWKLYIFGKLIILAIRKTMFIFFPNPIWSPSCILQHDLHETGFR